MLAVAYTTAGRIDMVDANTLMHTLARVPLPFSPALTVRAETGRTDFVGDSPNVRAGYIDCAGGSKLVFALFSGRRINEFNGMEPAFCRFVHVFDWQGALVGILELDHRAIALALDEEASVLFTLAADTVTGQSSIRRTVIPASW